MTRLLLRSMAVTAFLCNIISLSAQDSSYDVFQPISKYMVQGDAEKLSAWFSDNLEVSIFSKTNDASKTQAKQIMKSFFKSHTPRSFVINHRAGRSNMKYALGTMNAGGEMLTVTIFVNLSDDGYKIQHLKIERAD